MSERDGVPYVKTFPTVDDFFDDFVRAGIPPEIARREAKMMTADQSDGGQA